MVAGNRELIAGVVRDPQFGPTVMLGVGGILAEAVADVQFRPVPISEIDAAEMIDGLATQKLLGAFRGEAGRRPRRAHVGAARPVRRWPPRDPTCVSVDVNPLIVTADGRAGRRRRARRARRAASTRRRTSRARPTDAQFRALFEPKGVLVAGASTHPGKFGFVSAAQHPRQRLSRARSTAPTSKARRCSASARSPTSPTLPDGAIDLVFVCTPAAANAGAAARVRGEGRQGRVRHQRRLRRGRRRPAGPPRPSSSPSPTSSACCSPGPNGQGLVSTPASLCAQIVAPYPPRGRIAVASQSGNFVSSFMNYARQTGVGISRAVSAGNAAAVTPADYLDWYADDDETAVSLAYVEGIVDGRDLLDTLRRRSPRASRSSSSRAARPRAAPGRRPATPARWPPTTRCSTACVARPASPGRRRSRRPSRPPPAFATQPLPTGPERRRADHRRRMGCGHLRRDRPRRRACTLLPLPADLHGRDRHASCRRGGAATTRSTAPAARPVTRFRK